MALRKPVKVGLLAIVVGAAIFGITRWAKNHGYLNGHKIQASQEVGQIDLPTAPANAASTVPPHALPSDEVSSRQFKNLGKCEVWQWNAHLGAFLANGGANTTAGSIMEENGVKINFTNQEDVPTMQQGLVKFATAYKENPQSLEGTQFVTIMGDASAQFLAAVNSELSKLGPEYIAQVFYSCGRSAGEDAFMGLPEWKTNPQSAKGCVVSTVVRDGDWNIVVKWAGDNKIRINPDVRTYDPEAINFIAADNNIDAAQKYVSQYSEERPVVMNGKPTGETKKVTANGASVWTPSDVTVATGRGGLVRIVSTKEYASQMPNFMIGIKKHLEDNSKSIQSMILAFSAGSDQVKSYSVALNKACDISAKIYNANDAAYWKKYYIGVTEADKQGMMVQLGGSAVHNLADNLNVFGLASGSTNTAEIVYKNFGNVVKKLYPSILPEYPEPATVFNFSFLRNAMTASTNIASASESKFDGTDITQAVSKRSYSIEFRTGSAEFTPAALAELEELFDQCAIASNLKIDISGHTDNTGNYEQNVSLSQARANAVKSWLESKSNKMFPAGRIKSSGYGPDRPVGDNLTEAGRSKNRRVEIILGSIILVLVQAGSGVIAATGPMKKTIIQLFTPNSNPTLKALRIMWAVELVLLFAWWFTAEMVILPTPIDILSSFDNLAKEDNVLGELWISTVLCLKAMGIATLLSMLIAYSGKIPVLGGVSWLSSKMRFLSMIGISFVFLLLFSGYNLKLSMLTFGITGFMVVSMQNMLAGIKTIEYNHARTLGMGPWRVLWEVDIKSRIHEVLTIMASNIAISWVMLSFVEGRVRSGGGIGVLMLVQEKKFDMASVFMMQLMILTVAILMDLGFNALKRILAPYSTLDTQSK